MEPGWIISWPTLTALCECLGSQATNVDTSRYWPQSLVLGGKKISWPVRPLKCFSISCQFTWLYLHHWFWSYATIPYLPHLLIFFHFKSFQLHQNRRHGFPSKTSKGPFPNQQRIKAINGPWGKKMPFKAMHYRDPRIQPRRMSVMMSYTMKSNDNIMWKRWGG